MKYITWIYHESWFVKVFNSNHIVTVATKYCGIYNMIFQRLLFRAIFLQHMPTNYRI